MKIGDFVRFTKAHNDQLAEPCWGIVESRSDKDRPPACSQSWAGTIVLGTSPVGGWVPGSDFKLHYPRHANPAWANDNIRYRVVPEAQVPGEVWAALATRALIN